MNQIPRLITENEYWELVELIHEEVDSASIVYHTYEEIKRLALESREVMASLDENAQFWITQLHSLQTTLFLILSRVFDSTPRAQTIHVLMNATLANIQFFSADALYRRKIPVGLSEFGLQYYVQNAWKPVCANDLRHLKKNLANYSRRFEKIYRPIRNSIYAHRLMTDHQAAQKFFGATSRTEIGEIIEFLQQLVSALRALYQNGTEPIFANCDMGPRNQNVRVGVQNVLRSLVRR